MRGAVRGLAALVAAGALGAGALAAAPAGAAEPAGAADPAFYLALGASDSVGVQPALATGQTHPTDRGYANDVAAALGAAGTPVALTQLGCPGETTASMISGADRCYAGGDSQLAQAVAFLRAHVDDHGVVSIDLGFNDVRACLAPGPLGANPSCLAPRLAAADAQLGAILAALRAAAGPHVVFVGLNHFDPFVAAPARHLRDALGVGASVGAVDQLNETLADAYGAAGVPVAEVTRAFDQGVTTPTAYPGLGVVPAEVARVCELTWMCRRAPRGPNIHPNDAGYLQIAAAVLAALPANWASA